MDGALFAARKILEEVTPLKADCGRVCDAACCASLEGEETGMLLFPGEEALCRQVPGGRIEETATGTLLLICRGTCAREERPLSCRLFPLFPEPEGEQIHVRMDARAGAVCPLAGMGLRALSPTFVEAVRQAGKALMGDPEQRVFLERLAAEQRELRALKTRFGSQGKGVTP